MCSRWALHFGWAWAVFQVASQSPALAELLEKYDKNGDKKLSDQEIPENLALVSRGHPDGVGDMTFRQMFGMLDRNRDKAIDAIEWTGAEFFAGTINNALMATPAIVDGKLYIRTAGHLYAFGK